MNEKFKELYSYVKSKGMTDLNESDFYNAYKDQGKFKDLYNFVVDDNMTDLNSSDFYNAYFKESTSQEPVKKEPVKKKDITVSSSADGSLVSQSSEPKTEIEVQPTEVESRYGDPIASKDETSIPGFVENQAKKEIKQREQQLQIDQALSKLKDKKEPVVPEDPTRVFKDAPVSQFVDSEEEKLRKDIEDFGKRKMENDPFAGTFLAKNATGGTFEERKRGIQEIMNTGSEEYAVPELNKNFNKYGFTFEETGDGNFAKVSSSNNKSIEISFEGKGLDALKLMKFLDENKEESEVIKNIIAPEIQKDVYVKDEEDIKKAVSVFNNETKKFDEEVKSIVDEGTRLKEYYQKEIEQITPEELRTDKEKRDKYNLFMSQLNDLKSKESVVSQKEKSFIKKGEELDRVTGEYTFMKAKQGTWAGGMRNAILDGLGGIAAGLTSFVIDASLSGIAGDEVIKQVKYGDPTYRNKYSQTAATTDLDEGVVEAARGSFTEFLGDKTTTEQWSDMQKESFWGGALLGVLESLPGMVAPGGFAGRTAAMFLQVADGVNEEMSNNPEFDNVTEAEKALVSIPIGIAVGALESVGFSNMVGQKGLLNGLVARALGKSSASTTAKSFSNFIKEDVENMLARGVLTIGAGGLAEFETGTLQEVAETGIKQIYNEVKGKDMFQTPETFSEYALSLLEAGAQEAVGGMIMGSPKAVSNAVISKDVNNLPNNAFEIFQEISKDPEYKSMYISKLKQQVISGEITPEQSKIEEDNLNKLLGIMPSIDPDLSIENQKKALELIYEKQSIESKIEGKEKPLVKKKQNRIDDINKELEALSETVAEEVEAEEVEAEEVVPETIAEEVEAEGQNETIGEVINRPAELQEFGGVKFETPLSGDLYIDNQSVVFETSDGKIYEIGNKNEIESNKASDYGIKYETPSVKVSPDGSLEFKDTQYSIQSELPTSGIEYNEDGSIKAVSVKDSNGKPTMFKDDVANEMAYQILLNEAESDQQQEKINEILEKDEEFQNELRKAKDASEKQASENIAQNIKQSEKEVALDEDSIEEGKKEVESISTGQVTTTKPVKIFKGIGGKKDLTGSRINAHEGVKGIFSAVDQDLANEYSGDEGVSEVVLPEGTTVEVVEIDGTGMGVNEYRKAEVDAINNSKAQVVKLRTVDGVMKKGAKKQDQYIIKDESIMNELSPRSTTSVNEEIKVLESKFSKKEETVDKVDLFESLLDSAIKATKLDRTKLQSNPLGIAQPILHESLKIVRTTYKATKSSAKAIKKGYDFLVNKGYKGSQKEYSDYLDTLNRPSVDEVRSFAKENKLSDKSVREYLKKFNYTDAEIKVAMKKAPSVSKVLGKTEKKVTVNEMSALKDQIRLESKAARQSVKAYKDISKGIKAKITALSKKGVITASMSKAMIRKVLSTNMMNEKMVSNLVSYIDNVFTKAGLADKINTANKRRKTALKNLRSKVGPSKELSITLRELFSIDPSLIPLSKFDKYSELLDQFGERKKVLNIEQEINEALNNAYDILNSVEEVEVSNQETTKSKELNETIEKDLDGYLNGIVKDKIDVDKIENKDSKSLAEFFNSITKEDLEGLISKDKDGDNNYSLLENIKELKEIMKNGYFPKLANDLKNTIEQNRSERELTDIVKNKVKKSFLAVGFSRAYGKIKSFFMTKQSEKNMFLQMLRGNVTTAMDDLLGNFNSTKIYDNTIGKLAEAFSRYQVDVAENVQAKLKIADSLLFRSKIPTIQRQDGKVKRSRYKIQMYRFQREFLSNPDNKQVSSAIDIIDATIKAIRDGETDIYSEADAKILEDLKKEFSKDGQIDMKAVENNFTSNEKKALKLIDEVNEGLEEKHLWTANVTRGVGSKPIRNYVHHNVISNKGRAVSESESLSEKFNSFSNASTEAKTIRERTVGAKALNFDPITSTSLGARETLLDYHMTDAYRVVKGTLKNMLKNKEDFNDYQRKAIKAIESLSNELVENVFGEQILTNTLLDTLMREAVKVGYQNALASVPRAFSELSSNISYVMFKPSQIVKGIKTFGAFSYGSEGADAMKNLKSSEVMRLYDEASITSRMTDSSLVNEKRRGNRATKSMFLQKLSYLSQFTGLKQAKMLTDKVSEKLISTPDLAVARPFWFGSFAVKFKELTGESLSDKDMEAISKGDSKYLGTKYKEAVDLSSNFADSELIAMANSKNPFNSVAKNMKKSDEALMNTYRVMNSYMASFMINEYSTGRKATLALFYKGDITRKQAAATLAGLVSRQVIYLTMLDIAYKAFDSLISGEEGAEEEEEDLVDKIFKNTLSSVASMVFTRNLGNVTTAVSNHIIERANKEYLGFLRGGEGYDPYKHGFTFNRIKERDLQTKTLSEIILGTAAGPLSPQLKGAENILKAYQNRGKSTKPKKVEKWQDYLDTRLMIEGLGGVGLLPLYKDIRRAAEKDLRKKYKKD